MDIVDRRLNPKAKSLGNRQRFLRRAKGEIRDAVRDAIKKRKISEVDGGEKVRIRSKSLREPSFSLGQGAGERDFVLPGNREFSVGDVIRKPEGGGGGSGQKGAPDGSGEDDFVFNLSREEFLDLFFEDLKLPNLVKAKLKDMRSPQPVRAGHTSDGPPARLNQLRTMRNSMARRIALHRPRVKDLEELQNEIARLEALDPRDNERIAALKARLSRLTLPAQGRRLYRSARFAVQPLRAPAEAEDASGDVLPDGRLGVDDGAAEGSCQALLHAAAPVPRRGITPRSRSSSSATPPKRRRSTRKRSSRRRRRAAP